MGVKLPVPKTHGWLEIGLDWFAALFGGQGVESRGRPLMAGVGDFVTGKG
jgi:hypothetical protein